MIYLSLMILLVLMIPLKKNRIRMITKSVTVEDIVFYLIVALMLLICSLRSVEVGKDTRMYYRLFERAKALSSLEHYLSTFSYFEYGYWILNFFFAKYLNFQSLLALIGALSILPAAYVIKQYSKDKIISLILYIGFPFFTFSMQALRQAPAIGMVLLAYDAMKKKKLTRYLLFCLLAFFFHTSAILFLPAFWIGKLPYKKWMKWLVPAFIILSFALKSQIQTIILTYARSHYATEDAGGYRMFAFILLTVVLGMIYRRYLADPDDLGTDWNELFFFQVIVAMMWPISSFNPAVSRMYYYYQVFLALFVPQLTSNIQQKTVRIAIHAGYIFVSFFFLIYYQLPAFYKLEPYSFFWQIG